MAQRSYGREELALIERWLENNDDSRSELLVKELGTTIKDSLKARSCLPTNSAMGALHLPLQLIGVGPGDEVIVDPVVTFAGMAVMYQNAVPVFADIEVDTFNMSPESVRQRITERTRAIICTHHFGSVADMAGLLAVAKEFKLTVIEDCAHALKATQNGTYAGLFGDFSAFSFNHRKQLSTGQGGFLIVNNPDYVEPLNNRAFGRIPGSLAWNYQMAGIVAALALAQWPRVDEYIRQDMKFAKLYNEAVEGSPLIAPQKVPSGNVSTYHIWAGVYNGDAHGVPYEPFMKTLRDFGGDYFLPSFIPAGTFGLPPSPVYRYPIFREPVAYGKGCPVRCPLYQGKYDTSEGLCPNAEHVVPRLLNTVLSPLRPERLTKYAEALNKTIRHYS
ncbi:MAG TPA: DegT/DnrJ/EryC1/StrS family aminotransferase [Vicinamibacterales bacterium]|jgi:dTDP-4-amino-4,6-dideoxygalactose transaminase